ncbi:Innexin unc-9, partial [Trichinella britovi]
LKKQIMTLPFLDVAFRALHKQYYDDFTDRLNYYYTTLFLLFMSILVSAKQYVGSPIHCWVPAQFRGGWEEYAESYCFIQNTYFLPFGKDVPSDIIERDYRKIGYYQWVPVVLALQAALFYMPNLIWKMMSYNTGIKLKSLLQYASSIPLTSSEERTETVNRLCLIVEDCLNYQASKRNVISKILCFYCRQTSSCYLTFCYLLMKLLYLINVCGQFLILNDFLSTKYTFWGLQILMDIAQGRDWNTSGHFPRVTFCDFEVRELGNSHRHTVQCVLMINMFNEKIYLFFWFWFLFLGIITGVNLMYWVSSFVSRTYKEDLVRHKLRLTIDFKDRLFERRLTQQFIRDALHPDGLLIMRFIGTHAGELISSEMMGKMFRDYMKRSQMSHQVLDSVREKDIPSFSSSGRDVDHGFSEAMYDDGKAPNDGSLITPLLPTAPKMVDTNTLKVDNRFPPEVPPKPKDI